MWVQLVKVEVENCEFSSMREFYSFSLSFNIWFSYINFPLLLSFLLNFFFPKHKQQTFSHSLHTCIKIIKFWPFIKTRLNLSHLKWSKENQRQNVKKNISCCREIEPRTPGFSRQCSIVTDYNNPRLPRPSFILLSAVSYSTDHQLCAIRTPFQCRPETPPPPERSHN